jgi:hypothetical protein
MISPSPRSRERAPVSSFLGHFVGISGWPTPVVTVRLELASLADKEEARTVGVLSRCSLTVSAPMGRSPRRQSPVELVLGH